MRRHTLSRARIAWLPFLILVLALSLAACGDDDAADQEAEVEVDAPEPEPDEPDDEADEPEEPEGEDDADESEAADEAGEAEPIEVAVSHTGLPGFVITVMQELGFAEEHDLDLEVVDLGPAEAQVALGQGRVDVGMMPVVGAIHMNTEGVPLRVIAPMNANHLSLVTHEDSEHEDIADLEGLPVAVIGRAGLAYTDFRLLAAEQGLDIEEDVELFAGDGGAVMSWILEGDVEAGPLWEGVLTGQLVEGDVPLREMVVYRNALEDLYGFVPLGQGWAASEDWIEDNPDLAKRFQRAAIQAVEAIRDDPTLIVEYGDTFGPQTEEGLEAAAERAGDVFISEWNAEYIADQEAYIDRYIELGLLSEDAPGPQEVYLLLD